MDIAGRNGDRACLYARTRLLQRRGIRAAAQQNFALRGYTAVHSYMEMLHADLPFVRYSDCMAKIETVKHASTRKNMRLLVKKLSDCKCYAQAVKNSELSESQLRTVRKQFEKLGTQPITLKDKSEIEELKFVL